MKPIKICIVCLYSYPLFNVKSGLVFGGSEVRAALFAKAIATDPRFKVSFVVLDHDKRRMERFGNIEVWRHSGYRTFLTPLDRFRVAVRKMLSRKDHFPYIRWRRFNVKILAEVMVSMFGGLTYGVQRSLKWRPLEPITCAGEKVAPDKVAIYRTIDADVYCTFGVNEVSAEVATFCEAYGKKAILMCGSDYDLLPTYAPGSKECNLYGCRADRCYQAIVGAHRIVTQTQTQARLLGSRFGRESTIIPNPIDLAGEMPPLDGRPFALWIGKSDNVKRPELALELARRQPNVKMVLVMNRSLNDKFHEIVAAKPPNVVIVERVPIDKIERLFARAFALVNTSDFEGFPNTFLQAGKYAVPILSLNVDPDGFIEDYGCGIVAHGNMERLSAGLGRLAHNLPDRERFGARIRNYVENHHDLQHIVRKLIEVIDTCVTEPARQEPHRSVLPVRRAS